MTVTLRTPFRTLAAPKLKVVPDQLIVAPSRFDEYADPTPSIPPVDANVVPSEYAAFTLKGSVTTVPDVPVVAVGVGVAVGVNVGVAPVVAVDVRVAVGVAVRVAVAVEVAVAVGPGLMGRP